MSELFPATTSVRETVSNWKRPGGTLAKIVAGGAIIGGAVGLYKILPWLITLTTNMLTLGLLVASLGGILFVLTDKQFQKLFSYKYFSVMRKLTNMVVESDPIAILQKRIQTMREKIILMDESIGKVNKQYISNKRKIEEKKELANRHLARSQEFKKQGTPQGNANAAIEAQNAEFALKLATNYMKRNVDIGKWLEILKKLKEYADFTVRKTESEVEFRIEDFKSVKEQYKAYGFFKSIVKGNPQEVDDFKHAMEFMVDDIDSKLGEMDYWLNSTGGIMDEIDVEKGINNQKAMQLLQKYETEGFDNLFKSFQPSIEDTKQPKFDINSLKNNDNIEYINASTNSTEIQKAKQNTYF